MKKVLLWGAGGHGKVVLDLVRADSGSVVARFYDDDESKNGTTFCGIPVIAGRQVLENGGRTSLAGIHVVIAIGDNHARSGCFGRVLQSGMPAATLVHPSAVMSPDARVGPGTVVLARAVINAGADIGRNCIINTGAIVEHDCRIGDHVHVSPAATLGGGVVIGSLAQIGIGTTVLPGVHIGEETLIGGGCVVIRDAPPHETLVGVPARIIHRR